MSPPAEPAEPPHGPLFDLTGKVVVITGATRGIGRQIAFRLGRAGARLVLVGRTGADHPNNPLPGSLAEVCAALAAEGIEARSVQANLVSPEDTAEVVERTLEWHGGCDVLVNNAAFTSNGPIMEIPWARWEKAFRVQVAAPMQLCQGLVPGMLERGSGRVLNISSGSAIAVSPYLAVYSTSKQAMERWNASMHLELGGRGVAFNVLRVDRVVTTEGVQYVIDTKGMEVATGGQGMDVTMTPEETAAHAEWLICRPDDWSGKVMGFNDIAEGGGPPAPPRD